MHLVAVSVLVVYVRVCSLVNGIIVKVSLFILNIKARVLFSVHTYCVLCLWCCCFCCSIIILVFRKLSMIEMDAHQNQLPLVRNHHDVNNYCIYSCTVTRLPLQSLQLGVQHFARNEIWCTMHVPHVYLKFSSKTGI